MSTTTTATTPRTAEELVTAVRWIPCIPLPSQSQAQAQAAAAATATSDSANAAASIEALEKQFGVTLPASYRLILERHAGDLPVTMSLSCQNTRTKKWVLAEMGPFYHVDASCTDELAHLHVAQVNQSFREDMELDATMVSAESSTANAADVAEARRTQASSSSSSSSSSSTADDSTSPLSFFAFTEDDFGRLFVIECKSGVIMLVDPTHKTGPFVVASDFDDLLVRMAEAQRAAFEFETKRAQARADAKAGANASATDATNGSGKHDDGDDDDEEEGPTFDPRDPTKEYEEEATAGDDDGDAMDGGNADDDGEYDGEDHDHAMDEDEDEFCCDVCLDVLDPADGRFSCVVCKDFDLCHECYHSKRESGLHKSSHEMKLVRGVGVVRL